MEIRTREDLEGLSGLVFPGGESTVMGKFLIEWGMMDRVRELIRSGMPVFGTCAGLILLCSDILDHPGQPRIGLLNASVRRNAFGRQIDSFTTPLELCPFPTANGNPTDQPPLEAVFIRAPLIEKIGPGVEVLARVNGFPVAVRQGNVLATSFHPELTDDLRLHQWVVDMAGKNYALWWVVGTFLHNGPPPPPSHASPLPPKTFARGNDGNGNRAVSVRRLSSPGNAKV